MTTAQYARIDNGEVVEAEQVTQALVVASGADNRPDASDIGSWLIHEKGGILSLVSDAEFREQFAPEGKKPAAKKPAPESDAPVATSSTSTDTEAKNASTSPVPSGTALHTTEKETTVHE